MRVARRPLLLLAFVVCAAFSLAQAQRWATDSDPHPSKSLASATTSTSGPPILDFYSLWGDWGTFTKAIAVDPDGNIIVAGTTSSASFPATPGAFKSNIGPACGGVAYAGPCPDMFIMKFTPDGSHLIWATLFGGSDSELFGAMATDRSGSIYLTGRTSSSDLPLSANAFQKTLTPDPYDSAQDAFVAKFDPDGHLVYSTYLGGIYHDIGLGLQVDGSGYAYVAGTTQSPDFPVTAGAYKTTISGTSCPSYNYSAGRDEPCPDVFISKLNSDGSSLIYSTFIGGTDAENMFGNQHLAIDQNGAAYVAGVTYSTDYPVT